MRRPNQSPVNSAIPPRAVLVGHATIDGAFGPAELEGHGFLTTTFAAGARTAWHTHPLGQVLIVTHGEGLLQIEGLPVQALQRGETVRIPPNCRHWHGADEHSAMTQISITDALEGEAVTWYELYPESHPAGGDAGDHPGNTATIHPFPKAA